MEAAASDRVPLMFVHGAWLSSGSWENFSDYFAQRGFDVSAPEWPRKHGDVEELREATDDIKGLGLTEIVDHYEEQIDALERAAGADRPLVRRPHRRAAARSRARTGRRGDEPGTAEGHPRAAVLLAESCGARARASVEVARRRAADARGVHVRLREHVLAGGREGCVRRATRFPRPARSSSRRASRTSTCTRPPRCTSRATSARRC